MLPQLLQRRCRLPVLAAEDGAPLRAGTVVVAPDDSHLLVVEGHIVLGRGARENGHRPSHDAMLRSCALAAGPHAVGVVVTGLLDDGGAGLAAIHRYGGQCLVQEPAEAEFSSMPRHALQAVPTARTVLLAQLAEEVTRVVQSDSGPLPDVSSADRARDQSELASAQGRYPQLPDGRPPHDPSVYACPDCRRRVQRHAGPGHGAFRCRTGHAWSAQSLLSRPEDDVEEALWIALRVLEERANMSRQLAQVAGEQARTWSKQHFGERAEQADRSAELIRTALLRDAEDRRAEAATT